MRSREDDRQTRNLIVVQLVELLVNGMAFSRINQSNTLIEEGFELSFELSGHILAGAVGTGSVGLVPVVGVMNIFQPAAGHDR
ncbi:MAG TPA: hypothetical protein PLF02_08800, partial [Anaerolineaceae bacterium]|nr:hypothetical protein [Anaerolineaceae bacterium]